MYINFQVCGAKGVWEKLENFLQEYNHLPENFVSFFSSENDYFDA